MERSNRVRALAVLMAAGIVAMAIVLLSPNALAATRTWDTDADFNAGTFSGVVVVGTGAPATVELVKDATDWRNEAPPANPGAREGPAMAYDSTNNLVVLFGGYNGLNQADTWVYSPSANNWTNKNPASHPSARAYSGMSFDKSNGTIVLFGGVSDLQNERDTWEYNAATNVWTQTTPATSPPALTSDSMAYYATAQRSVLVGQSSVSGSMETWAYNVATDTWANRVATFSPARSGQGVAYHAALDRLVLFGGAALFTVYGDTWEYNYVANTWTNTVAGGSGPPARTSMGLSYRSTDSSVWLFGGDNGSPFSDTWRYFDVGGTRTWFSVGTQRSPQARSLFGITDITANNKSVIFGGVLISGRASDTWSLGPAYRSSGTWTSATADSGGATVNYGNLTWSPTTQAPGTVLRFQVAASNDPAGPWSFRGPGPACDTAGYYTTSGTAICPALNNMRYLQVRANLLSANNLNTASMDWVAVDYNAPPSSPYIVLTNPANAQFDIPQTAPIFIRFSEAMNIASVSWTISPSTSVSSQWSEGNSALTLTPTASLLECKAYTVNITRGMDTQGFALLSGPVPNPWSFVTQCINPTITATSPVQGTTDVPLNANIVITFSEAMNRTTVNWTITPATALTRAWSGGDTVLTLSHAANFTQCMMHTVNITGKDLAGLALIPGAVANPFDFHTHCREPYIVSTSPSHLATNVATTANITVLFSEPMVPNTVNWTLVPNVALSKSWSNLDQTLTLSHTTPFTICQTYTANITSGKDKDEGLDLFPGQHEAHAPHPWKFTIACPNPFVVVTMPQDGATGVNQFANITVQFSKPMNNASVNWSISPLIVLSPSWDPSNQFLTFTHTIAFGCGLNTMQITNGTDLSGNRLIAGPAPNPWTFQPACPNPYIIRTSPADRATGVSLTADIVVTFNKPMNTLTVSFAVVPAISGGFTYAWNSNPPSNTTLTLSHATPFAQSTNYTATILGGAQDAAGNPLVSGPVPNPWRFRTVGVSPQITSTNPAAGASSVPTAANVVVVFSEAMNTTTVTATSNPLVTFTYSWSNGNKTVTMGHIPQFADCTLYTVTVQGKDTTGDALIAGPVPNPWTFTSVCLAPVITNTNPANAAVDVALDAPVFVNFSNPMRTTSVAAVFTPPVAVGYAWSNSNMSLRITHGTAFAQCTVYQVTVTGADTTGAQLGPGPVPNPWSFRTFCPPPQISSTVPANGATGVNPSASIVVTFSRGMDTATVSWVPSPGAAFSAVWTAGDTVLTLTPTPALAQCTQYTITILGNSKEGKALVAGPVPNPWSFTTTCFVSAPGGLQVSRVAPNIVRLTWTAAPSADSYRVYESQNRFAAWPWAALGTSVTTTFDATGHLTDGLTHYYIVRAIRSTVESTNSTMGVKIQMNVGFSSVSSNVRWFGLPYRSGYAKASDIATELGPSKIDVVAKWNPATQTPVLYYYLRGGWHGTDFTIAAGDGLYIGSVSAFSWVIVGTDRAVTLSFTLNAGPLGNVNWVSIPYTGTYGLASDLVRHIEGNTGPGANTKITEVVKWDATTQSLVRYLWTAGGWAGTDFAIGPGDGIYFRVVSSFTWQPNLITPEVP